MSSREIVLESIAHKQPKKLPLDLGSTPSSGISAIAYNNLRKLLGTYDGETKVYDVVQQVAQVDDDIISHFGVDVIDIGRAFNDKPEDWHSFTLADGSSAMYPKWFKPQQQNDGSNLVFDEAGDQIAKMPVGATFYDQTFFPYIDGYPQDYKDLSKAMNKVHWQKLAHSPWDNASDPQFGQSSEKRLLHYIIIQIRHL